MSGTRESVLSSLLPVGKGLRWERRFGEVMGEAFRLSDY
jgi:hypothetical protein